MKLKYVKSLPKLQKEKRKAMHEATASKAKVSGEKQRKRNQKIIIKAKLINKWVTCRFYITHWRTEKVEITEHIFF